MFILVACRFSGSGDLTLREQACQTGARLERGTAKLERGVSDAHSVCGACLTQQCSSPAAEEALAFVLVSYTPLAQGRIFPREVIARGGSRRR